MRATSGKKRRMGPMARWEQAIQVPLRRRSEYGTAKERIATQIPPIIIALEVIFSIDKSISMH